MLIRLMKDEDIARVCAIEKELFSLSWRPEDFLDMMKNDDNIYLVAEIDGEVVAYCGLMGVVGEGHITNVAVSKKYQHMGIAYKMLSELIEKAKSKGCNVFTLEVRIGNIKAINLYKKLGFKNSGIRPNFYAYPREDALIMWL